MSSLISSVLKIGKKVHGAEGLVANHIIDCGFRGNKIPTLDKKLSRTSFLENFYTSILLSLYTM